MIRQEVLFRGKREKTGEWVDGYLIKRDEPFLHDIVVPFGNISQMIYAVIRETVGQYTGMWDCKGKMIFDGDIVAYNKTSYCVGILYGAFVLERIDDDIIDYEDFPQNSFPFGCDETEFMGVRHDYLVSLFELASNEQDFEGSLSCAVIGNRWDNPELLEAKNE